MIPTLNLLILILRNGKLTSHHWNHYLMHSGFFDRTTGKYQKSNKRSFTIHQTVQSINFVKYQRTNSPTLTMISISYQRHGFHWKRFWLSGFGWARWRKSQTHYFSRDQNLKISSKQKRKTDPAHHRCQIGKISDDQNEHVDPY